MSASVATVAGSLRTSITATNCAAAPATRNSRARSAMRISISLVSMKLPVFCVAAVISCAPVFEPSILPAPPRPRCEREVREKVLRLDAQRAVRTARKAEVHGFAGDLGERIGGVVEVEAEK